MWRCGHWWIDLRSIARRVIVLEPGGVGSRLQLGGLTEKMGLERHPTVNAAAGLVEVVPAIVEVEVAVARLRPASW